MKNYIAEGTTSKKIYFVLRSASGNAVTGLTYSDFTITTYVDGDASETSQTLNATQTDLSGDYTENSLIEVGSGKYQYHVPDTVFASVGESFVSILSSYPDVHIEYQVGAIDVDNAVSLGLTALSGLGVPGDADGLVRGQDTDSLEDVADAVADEDLSGHTTDGTLGEVLTAVNTLTDKLEGMLALNGEATLYQYTEDALELGTATVTGTVDANIVSVTDTAVTDVDDFKADVSSLSTFDPTTDAVANVTLVDTVTTNTDMRGTDDAVTDISSLATSAEIAALNDISPAEVNSEVLDVMTVDTRTEPGQATPLHTISIAEKVDYIFKDIINKKDTDGDVVNLYNSDGTTIDQTQAVSDDGSTATKGAMTSGS